jgi:hypothetical protein
VTVKIKLGGVSAPKHQSMKVYVGRRGEAPTLLVGADGDEFSVSCFIDLTFKKRAPEQFGWEI